MLQRLEKKTFDKEVLGSDFDYLRLRKRPSGCPTDKVIRTVDLFAGCGGTTLGVEAACHTLGLRSEVVWAIDSESAACAVFNANFPEANIVNDDIQNYFESDLGSVISEREKSLKRSLGEVDLMVGGPPCQGHSDLNNFSRRSDKKNALYLYMARAAKVLQPKQIIIENVQGLPHDRGGVLDSTLSALEDEGYNISCGLVDLTRLGVPQKRRRHIVIASRVHPVRKLDQIIDDAECPRRSVSWAISDLVNSEAASIVDTPSRPSKDNRARIEYLFTNGLFDLPNDQRPPCHRDKKQTYNSVYGRLRWNEPSQTITSGFYSMCMGRYVHPELQRTLTAHEAGRLQFFPDFFRFEAAGTRTALAKIIGNAVPMKLSYVLSGELLREQ